MDADKTSPALPATITRVSYRFLLPSQNTEYPTVSPASPELSDASLWGMRRGETAILQKVTQTIFYHTSRFAPYYGYYGHDDTPAIVETLSTHTYTGRNWK